MDKEYNLVEKIKELFATGFGLIFWCFTGGLMLVHTVSFFMGMSSFALLLIGIFVPPVGITNAIIFILSGDSIEQYF